ncbi:MAG TPA: CPBP family glutamic-type intramembrane protease [Oculatellaceae cyanobacterium]
MDHFDTLTFNLIWLVVFIVAGVPVLRLKDDKQKLATYIMVVLMTFYVGCKYYQSIFVENRLNSNKAVDVERAELVLRIASALNSMAQQARETSDMLGKLRGKHNGPAMPDKMKDPFAQAEEIIAKAVEADPKSVSALGKLIVVRHESKEAIAPWMEKLSQIKTEEAQALYSCLSTIYEGHASSEQIPQFEQTIQRQFGAGWYQDYLLEALYKQSVSRVREHDASSIESQQNPVAKPGKESHVTPELRTAHAELQKKNSLLAAKMVILVVFGIVSVLVGIVLIFVQLLFVARRSTGPDESYLVKAPMHSSALTIYGVFMAWLTTQNMVSSFLQTAMKPLVPYLKGTTGVDVGGNKPLLIALMVAVLYAATNGPGTLYAYLFAMRPHKIGFFEGFRLRARVGKRGPFFLALMGLATWYVAVPLVLVVTFIGSKYLGSQGSNNPIIGLILEAARSGNPASTIFFYLTLAVLAPICEETLFRGFLYANLRRSLGVFPSMAISAALFAAFHMDVGAFLPLFTLGSLFALVFEKHKSIVPSMVAHGLWNGGTFTLLLMLAG